MSIKTKGRNLEFLSKTQLKTNILPQMILTKKDFDQLVDETIIKEHFRETNLFAIRSSSIHEDQEVSNAGKFLTILNVTQDKLIDACAKVFSSYDLITNQSEVLIQPYISDSQFSGVVFTKDPGTRSPYYVVNYHIGSNTSSVTSGFDNDETVVIVPELEINYENYPNIPFLSDLLGIIKVLVELMDNDSIDIEFLVKDESVFILQVRSLFNEPTLIGKTDFLNLIEEIKAKVQEVQNSHPYLYGDYSILGVMPDWNPAELLGIRPNTLALSLFKELISDQIWAYERYKFGYRDLRSFPLLVEINGQPYIDTRVSFNSLLPHDLNQQTGRILISSYLEKLSHNQELHDKVEFEIIHSSYTFTLKEKLKQEGILSNKQQVELFDSLKNLTSKIIQSKPYGLEHSQEKSFPLEYRYKEIVTSNLSIQSRIYWLIEDCKRYGTLPFAGVARAAFIATNIFESLIEKEVLDQELVSSFISSSNTITTDLLFDLSIMSKEDFLDRYGHLRPGTFDILVDNYNQGFDKYFSSSKGGSNSQTKDKDKAKVFNAIFTKLESTNIFTDLPFSTFEFLKFAQQSIFLREHLKFNFSKNISKILELISEFGEQLGYTREDMSFSEIGLFRKPTQTVTAIRNELHNQITTGKEKSIKSHAIWLPPLITGPIDVGFFVSPRILPNYITQKKIHGLVVSGNEIFGEISGKIALIESADPGFDWIFGKGICGLITAYGGVNSHMAIRANELGIPAIIGIGEKQFQIFRSKSSIFIDCLNRKFEML